MKLTTTLSTSLLYLAATTLVAADATGQRRRPQQTAGARWAHDGVHVDVGGTWHHPVTWKTVEATERPARARDAGLGEFASALSAAAGRKISTRFLAGTPVRSTIPRTPEKRHAAVTSKDKATAAAILDGTLWTHTRGGAAKKVATGLAAARHFKMAPDGGAVSYILGADLYMVTLADGKTHRITSDGGTDTFNGELDWVYQEEVYGRYDFNANWWSPAGGHLAYMRIDEEGVDTFHVIDHIDDQLQVEKLKYPKSGRINPRATLFVAATRTGMPTAIDLSKYKKEDEILIVRVGWNPAGDEIVYMVQNREQNWLDLNFADPATGASRTVVRESSDDSWVERLPMPRWLKDGSFLWESDRTGFRHFYRYATNGDLLATVTRGKWSAKNIIHIDEKRGAMAFYGNKENYSIGRHAYVVGLDGKGLRCVTKGRGTHAVQFNKAKTMLIDTFSSLANQGEQWLRSVEGGEDRKTAAQQTPDTSTKPQWHQIKARDGFLLDVTYTAPPNFDPTKKYPVWINTYSGPAAPSIRDTWPRFNRGGGDWFIQLQVNVRSATAAGMHATKACYKQFGVQELKDIEDAIDWLCEKPWADAARVGITGFSYGGYMTAYAMTHSDKFKCGIAGAGVYDWRLYDTIYTERYMQTPQNNAAGYDVSSVIKAAGRLKGHLLITHGTMDDNVHLQNAIQLVYALQKAGKMNFEFMPYARSRHGFAREVGRHSAMLMDRFRRKHL